MPGVIEPIQDKQTVTPDGQKISPMIDGVIVQYQTPRVDERGELTEVYSAFWGIHPEPLVYVYQVCARPKSVRGWVLHKLQDDRLFMIGGVLRWALFDNRPDSKTYKMLNVFTLGERNRALLMIPSGVYHAVKNIGESEAIFINMPTKPYNHANPDKYRLPLKNDLIHFSFDE